jgi:alpha-galactosidase
MLNQSPLPEPTRSRPSRRRWLAGVCVAALSAALAVNAMPASAMPAGAHPASAKLASAAPAAATRATAEPAINDLAKTPYLGWNTYYGLGSNFNAQTIASVADAIVSRGLKAAGYQYVWIDGGWWSGTRDAAGNITVDAKQWPAGMKAVADYVHSKGLKAGIYTDAGSNGCGGTNQGSYGRYQQDVNQFAAWGYDAVKVDFCGGEQQGLDPAVAYGQFRDALLNNSSHRPMLFNICNPFVPETGAAPGRSAYDSWSFGPKTGNSWRTDTDIGFVHNVQYRDLLRNLDHDAMHPEAAGPGHWNDPDYLAPELGMTPAEAQTQFSMWSMVAAPLIIGSDVRAISAQTLAMLTNREVLAVDQDKLGVQGTAIATTGNAQVWTKPLSNGDVAVALFNRGASPQRIATTAQQAGLKPASSYTVRDLWQHSTTETAGRIAAAVAPHSVVLLRVSRNADVTVTAPAVTLSPVSVPAAYPGSDLTLAEPGKPFTVSAGFENDAATSVQDVAVTLTVPNGWTIQPSGTIRAASLPTNGSLTGQWQVTPMAGALPGPNDLKVAASYHWLNGDSEDRATSSESGTASSATSVRIPSAPPSGSSVLSDHGWIRGTSGYLVPRLDQEVAGGPLIMHGTTYPKGIGTASPSTIDYYVGGNCTSLAATVGIDDSANFDPTGGTAVFQVFGDGQKLYDSGLINRSATHSVSADISGAKVISLVVGDGGDGGYNDRADWAGLQLNCGAPAPTVPNGPWPKFVAPQDQSATATSANDGYPASNAVDGDLTTIWHSQFSPTHDPLPISFTVDLKSAQNVTGLTYQPRLDGDVTGIITGYTIETSTDGITFSAAAPPGTWEQDSVLKSVSLQPVSARYVRLTATSAVNGYASASEFGVAVAPPA